MDATTSPSVFISYSSKDRKLLGDLKTMLAPVVRAGIAIVWWDGEIKPGQTWKQEIDKALASARLAILLVSSNFLASEFIRNEELPLLLEAARSRGLKLLWVPVSHCLYQLSPLRDIKAAYDPSRPLSELRSAERQKALASISKAAVEALGLEAPIQEVSFRDNPIYSISEHHGEVPRPPYPGLKPFTTDDADFFFGREKLTKSLLQRLGESHFLALLGSSGSGKSSLIYAGLIPGLEKEALPGSSTWKRVPVRPGSRPLSDLAGLLFQLFVGYQESFSEWHADFVLRMKNDSWALHTEIQQRDPLHLLIIVDPCEDILSPNPASPELAEHQSFFSNLLNASSFPEPKATVVLALRAEFYGHLATFPDLASRVGDHQAFLNPLQERELLQAITRPAEKVGLRFEDGLPEFILAELHRRQYAMPLLQEALHELWASRDGSLLTFAAYESFGGVEGAITSSAEAAFGIWSTSMESTREAST